MPVYAPSALSYGLANLCVYSKLLHSGRIHFSQLCQLNPFVPDPALKRGETGWFFRIFKNSYFIARTFRLHTQVPNALEKHLK